MSSSASQVYMDLLASSPVPVAIQRRILTWGLTHEDAKVLARLAQIDGLDPDIEAQLVQSTYLDVLLAWAQRPGQSSEALAERLMKEKRSSLLVGLAQRTDLTEDLYRQLASNKSVNVRWAILANKSVDIEIRKSVAKTLAPEFKKDNYGGRRLLHESLGTELDLWRIFLDNITTNVVVDTALYLDIVDKGIIDRMVTYLIDKVSQRNNEYSLAELAEAISRRPELDAENVNRMLPFLEAQHERIKHNQFSYGARRLEDLIKRLKARPEGGVEQLIESVRAADNSTDLTTAVETFKNLTQNIRLESSLLGKVVIEHKAVTFDLVKAHFRDLDYVTWAEYAQQLHKRGQPDLLAAVAMHSSLTYVFGWVGFDENILTYLLRRGYRDHDRDAARTVEHWLNDNIEDAIVDNIADLVLEYVPATELLSSRVFAGAAMKLMETKLGEDQRSWETFETLVSDFSGSLPELLDTVSSLAR